MRSYVQQTWIWAGANPQRLFFAAYGFVPIGCLCATLVGILPLHISLLLVILPATCTAMLVALWWPAIGRQALVGLIAGMIATAVYDSLRLSLVAAGLWQDFIPVIGRLALNDPAAAPQWGYAYRYVYDGGAMGITFAMLPGHRRWGSGLAFGVIICLCLFGTLLGAPHAQQILFALTPTTAATALAGHALYGAALGWLLRTRAPANVDLVAGHFRLDTSGAHAIIRHALRKRSGTYISK